MSAVNLGNDSLLTNEQVRGEIQIFLEALDSYPERFAKDPGISFEEHCTRLVRGNKRRTRPTS